MVMMSRKNRIFSKGIDKIMIDINLDPRSRRVSQDKGIPKQKVRFSVKRAADDDALIAEAKGKCKDSRAEETIKKELDEIRAKISTESDPKEKAKLVSRKEQLKRKLKNCSSSSTDLKQFLQAYRNLNCRVIGKAMSYARPGDRFEILLSLRHSL